MKKINVVLLSVLTVLLSGVLMACTFKDVKANFNQEEIVRFVGDVISLDDYLEVTAGNKSDITYAANSSMFEVKGRSIKAIKSGRGNVYAVYKGSRLASMQIVIGKPFDAPTNFNVDENGLLLSDSGLLTWSPVVEAFEGGSPTTADKYEIVYRADGDDSDTFDYSDTNSFQLPAPGRYTVSVRAKAKGYFDDGEQATFEVYYGFMPQIAKNDLTWQDGTLSWEDVEIDDARYSVMINDVEFAEIENKRVDLTAKFDSLSAGRYEVRIVVKDAVGDRIDMPSEIFYVTKLATPTLGISNGVLTVSQVANAKSFDLNVQDSLGRENVYDFQDGKLTGFAEGSYTISVTARNDSSDEFFFHSNKSEAKKVYKLGKLEISGAGGNAIGEKSFNVTAVGNAVTETEFVVRGIEMDDISGFEEVQQAGRKTVNVSLNVKEAGEFNVTLVQKAASNLIDGQEMFVVNSDESNVLVLTKIADFAGAVEHEYKNEKSTFSFAKVKFATEYKVEIDNDDEFISVPVEDVQTQDSVVTITLTGRIEDMLADLLSGSEQDLKEVQFRIVAKMADETVSIQSFTPKTLKLLDAPKISERQETLNSVSWTMADEENLNNVANYKIAIYKIADKETFNKSKESGEYDISDKTAKYEGTWTGSTYPIDEVGYYYFTIQALPLKDNTHLASQTTIGFVCYAEKQVITSVVLGFDENHLDAGAFYFDIDASEQVEKYRIKIGVQTIEPDRVDDKRIYLPQGTAFDTTAPTQIVITALAGDDALYLDSDEYSFKIMQIAKVTQNDLQLSRDSSSMIVNPRISTGIQGIYATIAQQRFESLSTTLAFALPEEDEFSVTFSLSGTFTNDGTYKIVENGSVVKSEIYLSSGDATLNFNRIDRPEKLEYIKGNLQFFDVEGAVGQEEYYALDVIATTQGKQIFTINVMFDSTVKAYYRNPKSTNENDFISTTLGEKENFITRGTADTKKLTIVLADILKELKDNADLKTYYQQADSLQFGVYAYRSLRLVGDAIQLSSLYASTKNDAGSYVLTVEKMSAPTLRFDKDDMTLEWDKVAEDGVASSETTYTVVLSATNGTAPWQEKNAEGGNYFDLNSFEFNVGTTYSFRLKASNSNYLDSSESNTITIRRLAPLSGVTLTNDTLTFTTNESGNFKVFVAIGDATPAKEVEGRAQKIDGPNTYTFTLVGVDDEETGTYLLDSQSAQWNVVDMSTKAGDLDVTFNRNVIQWSAYASDVSFETLTYYITFDDGKGHVFSHTTTDTMIDLNNNPDLVSKIANLVAGDISVGVYAHLGNYSPENRTIYYHPYIEGVGYNYLPYFDADGKNVTTIKKHSTPVVKNVEFVYDDQIESSTYLQNAQTPDIKVTFEGNYGDGEFKIMLGDDETPVSATVSNLGNGQYSFTLTSADYARLITVGGELVISITALTTGDNADAIPSTAGSVKISVAKQITMIGFEKEKNGEEETEYLSDILTLQYDENSTADLAGGIVLLLDAGNGKTTYLLTENVGQLKNGIARANLADFIDKNMADGGTLKVRAFVNSHSNSVSGKYVLACSVLSAEFSFEVLKSVVMARDITVEDGGFVLDSTSINSSVTKYELVCTTEGYGDTFTLSSSNNFTFRFPEQWESGITYTMTVVAKEAGKVSSKQTTITIQFTRLERVDEVFMTRAEDASQQITLYWTGKEGATSYILKVYLLDVEGVEDAVFTKTLGGTSFTLEQIFGTNYANLRLAFMNYLPESRLQEDLTVKIALVSAGGDAGQKDSKEYPFFVTFKGNNLSETKVGVSPYGLVYFDSAYGEQYFYRFVNSSGQVLEGYDWTLISSAGAQTILSTDNVDESTPFHLEVITVGLADGEELSSKVFSSKDGNFAFDSIPFSTRSTTIYFTKVYKVDRVTVASDNAQNLEFMFAYTQDSKLYAGVSEDAIRKQNSIVGKKNVIEFEPVNRNNGLYYYNFATLISQMQEEGLAVNDKIYFWHARTNDGESSARYVVSSAVPFVFNLNDNIGFLNVVKVGEYTNAENIKKKDYVNTYATFTNSDAEDIENTLGIFVRVTQLGETEDPYVGTIFISKSMMEGNEHFDNNVFAVNLTEHVFESFSLIDIYGEFSLEFMKVSESGNERIYTTTPWFKLEKTFERIPAVEVTLREGNLYWESVSSLVTKFYVYFASKLDGNIMGENIHYETNKEYFEVTEKIGIEGSRYYIGVQCINEENEYVISSKISFISEDDTPIMVYKNEIKTTLKLEGGTLYFDWLKGTDDSDFFYLLTTGTEYADIADAIATKTFTSPFTFTVSDILNSRLYVRFKFVPTGGVEGMAQYVDVPVLDILSDFMLFAQNNGVANIQNRFESIYKAGRTNSVQDVVTELQTALMNASHGLANERKVFDYYFEKVQLGEFRLEYRLLGNSKTLSSEWRRFANAHSDEKIYVNETPDIEVVKVPEETKYKVSSINSYKVLIKKSNIYVYDESTKSYKTELAKRYIVTLGTYVMLVDAITNIVSIEGVENTFTLYDEGDYLMFYINHNEGNSLLGVFTDINRTQMRMQIYAKGNDVSASSKSELFIMNFLSFKEFQINDGEFSWMTIRGRSTYVFAQPAGSTEEDEPKEIDGTQEYSYYSLDGLGADVWSIKFVIVGEVRGNNVYIDTDIYQIDAAYKLYAPTLGHEFGYISIDGSENAEYLASATGEEWTKFRYNITNDQADDLSINQTPEAEYAQKFLYEVGITGMDGTEEEYAYKLTEQRASIFSVTSLGSTAEFTPTEDEKLYYIKHLTTADGKNVAVKSVTRDFKASMLDSITMLNIENGILKWPTVKGRTDGSLSLPTTAGASVIYKIQVMPYKDEAIEGGSVERNLLKKPLEYFTANTYFDFVEIKEQDLMFEGEQNVLLKVTVQALALNVRAETDISETEKTKPLVEGGVVNGTLTYLGTETAILMSTGATMNKIGRLDPVTELSVNEEGYLTWKYLTKVDTENEFELQYAFNVTDAKGKTIEGDFTYTLTDEPQDAEGRFTYVITFAERSGQIEAGNLIVKVYATQGPANSSGKIKSFARELMVEKLAKVQTTHFDILQSSAILNEEYLTLEAFFNIAQNKGNTVIATVSTEGQPDKKFELSSAKHVIYIFTQEPSSFSDYCIVIPEEGDINISISFIVKRSGCLSSDPSDKHSLQRSAWDGQHILWNEDAQEFSWEYEYYSLSAPTTATEVEHSLTVSEETYLYENENLSGQAVGVLEQGARVELDMEDSGEGESAKIVYRDATYYVARENLKYVYVNNGTRAQGEERLLDSGTRFTIVERGDLNTIILFEGKYYSVATNMIVSPDFFITVQYAVVTGGVSQTHSRIYKTKDKIFRPTVMGTITDLYLRVKLNNSSTQSQPLRAVESIKTGQGVSLPVEINLFESGLGTKESKYVITNAKQFANMMYRQTKDEYLNDYTQTNLVGSETVERVVKDSEKVFYFEITQDIDLSGTPFEGFLFAGDFGGVINGNGRTIKYTSSGTADLTREIPVTVSKVFLEENGSVLTYTQGSALFERLTGDANISSLNLDVEFQTARVWDNALVSGLAITNQGTIENVNVTRFVSGLYGYIGGTSKTVMSYSGIVSINSGSGIIKNCSMKASVSLNDRDKTSSTRTPAQLIFFGGIAYTNYATISGCTAGVQGGNVEFVISCNNGTSKLQLAGIVVTSTQGSNVENCTNYAKITGENLYDEPTVTGQLAGICVFMQGGYQSNANLAGTPTAKNLATDGTTVGDVYADPLI